MFGFFHLSKQKENAIEVSHGNQIRYSQNTINAANEAVTLIEEGAKIYFTCKSRFNDPKYKGQAVYGNDWIGAAISISEISDTIYAITVLVAFPELGSCCKELNIFEEFTNWEVKDFMTIRAIGKIRLHQGEWINFRNATKELIESKHSEWIYNGSLCNNNVAVEFF